LNQLSLCWVGLSALLLAACSSVPKPVPTDIGKIEVRQEVTKLDSYELGDVAHSLIPAMIDAEHVLLVTSRGELIDYNPKLHQVNRRMSIDTEISAGVGSDGVRHAVISRQNDLIVVSEGKEIWRQKLTAQSFTPPLVAGLRVFVLLADRTVVAFDGATGRLLWTQKRVAEPLVLKQPGALLPYQNTLVAGLSGRLVGLDSITGTPKWEAPLAISRGTNDLERLVDIVGGVSRVGDTLCARAFLSQVGCVNPSRGQVLWTRPANGDQGLSGSADLVVGTETNGVVQAWQRSNGERVWSTDRLRYRHLSAPLVTPQGVVIGDDGGFVYLLSLADGSLLNRWTTDGSALAAAPIITQQGFLLITRKGLVQFYQFP